ncbi:uncharacterized protein LOC143187253 [Calliopsis andreniformis]|uniref:uncharacterized protein LOC143187253 n=1 Tax=Calliopsis andreniformis TaxID=337506 RepID=UPI003FCD2527
MDRSLIATSNAATFTECVLELVSNSLNANATAIAIRIHADKRKIQIVDNGIGISKKELETVAEYESKNSDCCKTQCVCDSQKTLVNIRRLCDAMLITSRYYNSSKTYMKVFKVWCAPKIVKVHRRPSQGTTVTIYGFHELSLNKWNIFSMHHLIATIAIINIQASFSIRDDQEKRIIMVASKSRSPIKSIHLLYNKEISFTNLWCVKHTRTSDINFHAYVALTKSYATQYIFLNNKPVYCPVILHMISSTFIALWHFFGKVQSKQILKPEAVFILLFIRSTQYIFSVEKGKRILILTSTQDLLHIIRSEIVNIFIKNIMPLPNSVAKYIRNHKNVMYNRLNTLNSIQIFKKTPMLLQPCASNKIEREMITNQLNLTQISCVVSQSFTSVSQNTNVIDEHHTPTLSEWSNWTYPELDDLYNPKKIQSVSKKRNFDRDSLNFYKRFNFLPEKLHKLLRGKAKLTKTNILNELSGSILSVKLKSGLESKK